jgi:2-keto-4-pentenoate hydratase
VLEATEAIALSVEVVDSRIKDWAIRIADTIADNASYGAFALGSWSKDWINCGIDDAFATLSKNGSIVVSEKGSQVMGHPGNAVLWLANKFRQLGEPLRAGEIVLSGSVGKIVSAEKGDHFLATTTLGQSLKIEFI